MKFAYIFGMLKNEKPTEYGMNINHNLSIGPHKRFRFISDYGSFFDFMQFKNKFNLKNTTRCLRIYEQDTGQSKIRQIWSYLLISLYILN